MNELATERSPYLLQHAGNPVHWKPWRTASFDKAQLENKPIFLSIGYASCHWCHVMERESFEDDEVASILNEFFVCVKVDREERPDIDSAYMEVCQAMTGHGGWPLSLILTPDKLPIYAGTYFPKHSRNGQIGFIDLMRRIAEVWSREHERLKVSGTNILSLLKQRADESGKIQDEELTRNILDKAAAVFETTFDELCGGFGDKPKFPTPHHYIFLLRLYSANGNEQLLKIVAESLDAMRRGGIYDHIGYGFHRYSVDRHWFLPHFEKMLYDQAMLAIAYAEAAATTGDARFALVCKEIFEYIRRDMTAPEGVFYSSEDADSEGKEGKFYTWTQSEIENLLPAFIAQGICKHFNVTPEGNYNDESTGEATGASILYESEDRNSLTTADLEKARKILLENRSKRARPSRDDKILTDWNGMMIAALAYCGRILKNNEYIELAATAAEFLLNITIKNGRLPHCYGNSDAPIRGFLDDYAFFSWGLFELYQATGGTSYLTECHKLCDEMLALFQDESGVFRIAANSENDTPFDWQRSAIDGSAPSGTAAALYILSRMGATCGETRYTEAVYQCLQGLADQILRYPAGFSWTLITLEFLTGKRNEIVMYGSNKEPDYLKMKAFLQQNYAPDTVILYNDGSEVLSEISAKSAIMRGEKTTAFICEEAACRAAAHTVEELRKILSEQ